MLLQKELRDLDDHLDPLSDISFCDTPISIQQSEYRQLLDSD